MADAAQAVAEQASGEEQAAPKVEPKAKPARKSTFMRDAIAKLESAAQEHLGKQAQPTEEGEDDDETEGEQEQSRSKRTRQDGPSTREAEGETGEDAAEEGELDEADDKPALTLDDILSRTGVKRDEFLNLIEVEVGDEKVGLNEMRDGYLRGRDYTQKAQVLARAHDEIIPYRDVVARLKTDEDFQEYVARYYNQAASALSDVLSYDQLMELTTTDPDRARDELGRFKKREMELQRWKSQKTQVKRELDAWKERQLSLARQKHKDYDKARTAIVDYLGKRGVSQAELNDNPFFEDARVIDILIDAIKGGFVESGGNKAADDLKVSLGRKRESPQPQKLSSGTSGHRGTDDKVRQKKISNLREKAHKGERGGWGAYLGEKYRL